MKNCEVCGLPALSEPFNINGPIFLCRACAVETDSILRSIADRMDPTVEGPQTVTIPVRSMD
jgi:hypothetical protein